MNTAQTVVRHPVLSYSTMKLMSCTAIIYQYCAPQMTTASAFGNHRLPWVGGAQSYYKRWLGLSHTPLVDKSEVCLHSSPRKATLTRLGLDVTADTPT